MPFGSEVGVIGSIVIGLAAIFGLFKYFSDHIKEQNTIYQRINENLIKNTMAIDNLNNYIKAMENEIKVKLERHEQRLNDHHDQLVDIKYKLDKKS